MVKIIIIVILILGTICAKHRQKSKNGQLCPNFIKFQDKFEFHCYCAQPTNLQQTNNDTEPRKLPIDVWY